MWFDRRRTRVSSRNEAVCFSLIDITCCSLVSGRWTGGCAAPLISFSVSRGLCRTQTTKVGSVNVWKCQQLRVPHLLFWRVLNSLSSRSLLLRVCLLQCDWFRGSKQEVSRHNHRYIYGHNNQVPAHRRIPLEHNTWLCHIWSFHWLTTKRLGGFDGLMIFVLTVTVSCLHVSGANLGTLF